MAKVSKQQLGRRRRRAFLVLVLLLIALGFGISKFVSYAKTKLATPIVTSEEALPISTTAETQSTTTTTIPGVAYGGTITMPTATTLPTEPAELPTSYDLDVTPVLQNPELPTGCEITSLTMALNFAGYDVDKLTMADEYLIRSDPYLTTFGEAFVGSPYDSSAWGCYAPVIVATAESYLKDQGGNETVQNITGCSLRTLLGEVASGTPVITWATINMTSKVEERYYWTTPSGDDAVFLINEHCLVLCGYDLTANTVTVCDPLVGKTTYDMDVFEDRYDIMYQQAVVIRSADTDTEQNTEATLAVEER